jgi:hypothetical protein
MKLWRGAQGSPLSQYRYLTVSLGGELSGTRERLKKGNGREKKGKGERGNRCYLTAKSFAVNLVQALRNV